MSSIAVNRRIMTKQDQKERTSLYSVIAKHITETAQIMAPGVFVMNNTYYRPVK